MGQWVSEQEARFYDIDVPDWPGEIDFYRAMTGAVKDKAGSLLEVGCGTGRIALRLAKEGMPVVGLDLSPAMLAVARQKSETVPNIRWVEGDMQAFQLGEHFDLVLIPGHSFQFMLTPAEQVACLQCIRQHLTPDGKLVIHVNHDDISWLSELSQGRGTGFELVGEYRKDTMPGSVRKWNSWSYEASTQTASAITAWELVGEDGTVKERKEAMQKRLHCFFRFEMEHLLARTGFRAEALYGDFFRQEFQEASPEMIWVTGLEQP